MQQYATSSLATTRSTSLTVRWILNGMTEWAESKPALLIINAIYAEFILKGIVRLYPTETSLTRWTTIMQRWPVFHPSDQADAVGDEFH